MKETAQARSQLFQLAALGFAHPVEEFHRVLLNGSYPLALTRVAFEAFAVDTVVVQPDGEFADFEAEYIQRFQVGRRGKPQVHLNAADYETLASDHSRPEFLLQYSDWFRHFGLKTNEDEQANELPDHISCQLEFMAWLSHLEARAGEEDLRLGYQRAQRDFCQRHLAPFLEQLLSALQGEAPASFHTSLTALMLECIDDLLQQLGRRLDTEGASARESIDVVNLWG